MMTEYTIKIYNNNDKGSEIIMKRECDYNCDDCRREICIEGGQDVKVSDLDQEDIEIMEMNLNYWFGRTFSITED